MGLREAAERINKENVRERGWIDSFPLHQEITIDDIFLQMIQNGTISAVDYIMYKAEKITAHDLLKKIVRR